MFGMCKCNTILFRIAKEINVSSYISKIIAFQPPKKPQYSIGPLNSDTNYKTKKKHCCRYEEVKFIHDTFSNISYKWIEEHCYTFKNTKECSKNRDKNIVILHLKNKNKPPGGFTLLISHGNACTLGTIYSTLIDFCTILKCDVIAYDYSGYGRSEGKPSEKEIYKDIEEVGFFVKEILEITPRDIILLGQSLGSAPTVHLAITKAFKEVRAIILISPIASGVKLVSPDIKVTDLDKIDVFCNIRKIVDVTSPIFLVHGQKDEVLPIEQSLEMAKFMKNAYEWHPRNGDHSNILTKYRTKFFKKCKFFIDYLHYYSNKQNTTNTQSSFHSFNDGRVNHNEKFKFRETNADDFLIQVEESYYGNNNKGKKESISNGHPFSAHAGMNLGLDIDEINPIAEEPINNLKAHEKSNNNNNNNSNKKINYHVSSQRNSIANDYPFDMLSEGCLSGGYKNSIGEDFCNRDSNGSITPYKNQKDLEDQYNKMLVKHNGI